MIRAPLDIRALGEALYGEHWIKELEAALGVSVRNLNRWAAGKSAPPPGVFVDLAQVCRERAQKLLDIAAEIEATLSP